MVSIKTIAEDTVSTLLCDLWPQKSELCFEDGNPSHLLAAVEKEGITISKTHAAVSV